MALQSSMARLFAAGALMLGLAAMQPATATPTVLTFDEFPSFTVLTTQYQSLGVTVSEAVVLEASEIFLPANTFPNVSYSPSGVMEFIIDRLITGDIQTVSGFLTGPAMSMYAYDAANALLGYASLPGNAPANTLVSFTTPGDSISRVQFVGGRSTYFVDTLSFTPFTSVPEPGTAMLLGVGLVGLITASRRKNSHRRMVEI